MENNERSYEYLLEIFTEEALLHRFQFLYGKAKEYIASLKLGDILSVNEYLIDEIVLDYFADIARLKNFHHIERVEPIKVASYTAYWVNRKKPIQMLRSPENDEIKKFQGFGLINEIFASSVFIAMVYNTARPIATSFASFNRFQKVLKYHLTYRQTTAQMLELVLYALDSTPIYEKL